MERKEEEQCEVTVDEEDQRMSRNVEEAEQRVVAMSQVESNGKWPLRSMLVAHEILGRGHQVNSQKGDHGGGLYYSLSAIPKSKN